MDGQKLTFLLVDQKLLHTFDFGSYFRCVACEGWDASQSLFADHPWMVFFLEKWNSSCTILLLPLQWMPILNLWYRWQETTRKESQYMIRWYEKKECHESSRGSASYFSILVNNFHFHTPPDWWALGASAGPCAQPSGLFSGCCSNQTWTRYQSSYPRPRDSNS